MKISAKCNVYFFIAKLEENWSNVVIKRTHEEVFNNIEEAEYRIIELVNESTELIAYSILKIYTNEIKK